jgi:hypothetical protein
MPCGADRDGGVMMNSEREPNVAVRMLRARLRAGIKQSPDGHFWGPDLAPPTPAVARLGAVPCTAQPW